jgi:FecR protein
MSKLTKAVLAALLVALAAPCAARAQYYDDDNGYGYSDPDIRQTVARLAYVSGDVSFARGDDPDDWQPANANIPMTLGDRTWTAGGRLELQVHGGNLIRLAQSTDLAALNLTEDTKQFSLSAGVASFRIRRLGDEEVFEVDTPNAAITFERTGDYRIDVRPDGDTRVQVRRGRAIVASGGGQVPLGSGDAMLIEGYEPPRYDMIGIAAPDGWDRWVADRDARYANVRSYDYVSADIAGVEDLDRYGRWQQVPNYGYCWTPASVAVGWQPYRVGRWIWQDPWGWTWVSSEPWGWAPYHYGRWVTWSSRWFWVPVAPRVAVVTYSPALVAFVGGGPGFSVSVGVGTDYIGWFPLAPRDPLIPWWGRPSTTVVNVTNITYVNRTYVTVVNQNTFVSSRAVATNYVRDQAIVNKIERAPIVRGAIPIAPTRESIRVSTSRATARRPPANVTSRAVVTRMAPPPAPPRFDQKVAAIRENRGRPVTTVEAERISEREGRASAQPARAIRPAAQESGRVTLAPKTEKATAPQPEPVAPVRGRPLATKEQPVAPSRETSAQRGRSAAPQRDTQPEGAPKDQEQEQRDQAARQAREKAQDQTQSDRIQREQVERQQDRRPPAPREPAEKPSAQRDQTQREQAQKQPTERPQAQREQAQREQAQKQQAERQQAQREQAQREQAQKQQAERQQAQREQAEKQQAQREQSQREQTQKQQAEKPQQAQQPQRARSTPRPAPESQERAQPQSDEKEKPASSSSSARGRGRPTPKPTPEKGD